MKKTLVLGATNNRARYAWLAVQSLLRHGHEVVPVGKKEGEAAGIHIYNDPPEMDDIDTITLYLNPTNQKEYYDYIIGLKPKRIIFNPGTENPELYRMARENGIEIVVGCTLVMLASHTY